jgi:hypothetical protein
MSGRLRVIVADAAPGAAEILEADGVDVALLVPL